MPTWSAGAATSTSGSERKRRGHETGWLGSSAPIQRSLLIGACYMSAAEHREPYEPRGSRTDLGARGGEIPLRDSPCCDRHFRPAGGCAQPEFCTPYARTRDGQFHLGEAC